MANEPANILYPETLAERAALAGKESGFEKEAILNESIRKYRSNLKKRQLY
ncbi:hypothetical protein CNEO2_560013 [Clostridium neonatale]|nr:hypothetical protein CNEO2_560013 [Clostridium neonatale]